MKSSRSATTPDRRLVVFVPELESLLREAGRPPRLVSAIARPDRANELSASCPQALLATGVDLAAAPLSRLHDFPEDASGAWMRADPIGLTPDLAAVWMQAEQSFTRGAWQQDLQALMADEGFELDFHPSGRGYLRLSETPDCRFASPAALAGNSLEHCLPEGPGSSVWRRLLNETQILLHQCADRRRGESVPGSLWFWGGGQLPAAGDVAPRIESLVADDPVMAGLAEWLALPCREAGDGVEVRGGELIEWPAEFERSADENLERLAAFLRPAWRQLRLGRLRALELCGRHCRWVCRPADAWRVWR